MYDDERVIRADRVLVQNRVVVGQPEKLSCVVLELGVGEVEDDEGHEGYEGERYHRDQLGAPPRTHQSQARLTDLMALYASSHAQLGGLLGTPALARSHGLDSHIVIHLRVDFVTGMLRHWSRAGLAVLHPGHISPDSCNSMWISNELYRCRG